MQGGWLPTCCSRLSTAPIRLRSVQRFQGWRKGPVLTLRPSPYSHADSASSFANFKDAASC
eukprot:9482605-Pyramimonas_sp.AAC.1